MNARMLKTELYKIYSKKVIWISLTAFLALFLVLKLQFIDKVGVKYTLEPVRHELTDAVGNGELHSFVKEGNYSRTVEDLKPYISASVFDYIEEYNGNERIYRSLNSDLMRVINNYYERIDNRLELMNELKRDITASDNTSLIKAKTKLLQTYENTSVKIELNLESSANNFIDVNHSAVFPGLIMLIVIVGLAGIYSDEYTSNTLSPLLTSRKGRKGVFLANCLQQSFLFSV